MAVVVNNSGEPERRTSGTNSLITLAIVLILLVLFFVYGLPAIRSGFNGGGAQINVPDKINVNVNQPQGGK